MVQKLATGRSYMSRSDDLMPCVSGEMSGDFFRMICCKNVGGWGNVSHEIIPTCPHGVALFGKVITIWCGIVSFHSTDLIGSSLDIGHVL